VPVSMEEYVPAGPCQNPVSLRPRRPVNPASGNAIAPGWWSRQRVRDRDRKFHLQLTKSRFTKRRSRPPGRRRRFRALPKLPLSPPARQAREGARRVTPLVSGSRVQRDPAGSPTPIGQSTHGGRDRTPSPPAHVSALARLLDLSLPAICLAACARPRSGRLAERDARCVVRGGASVRSVPNQIVCW
jgi:hypothetical protein